MTETDKKNILTILCDHNNLDQLNAQRLSIYLSRNGYTVSLPTINKYKKMLIAEKNKYTIELGFSWASSPEAKKEAIERILKDLLRNKRKISERSSYRYRIQLELKYFKKTESLIKNQKNIYAYNTRLKKLKKDTYSKLKDIPIKTFNYLYNDEAKKIDLLSKRSIIDPTLIEEIDSQFRNKAIQKAILEIEANDLCVPQLIQNYIKKTYDTKFSLSMIQRYFQKYLRKLRLDFIYKNH